MLEAVESRLNAWLKSKRWHDEEHEDEVEPVRGVEGEGGRYIVCLYRNRHHSRRSLLKSL